MLSDGIEQRVASDTDVEVALARLNRLNESKGGENVVSLRSELQGGHAKSLWSVPKGRLYENRHRTVAGNWRAYKKYFLEDKSKTFNTARIEALELENLYEVALATAVAAEARNESRGGMQGTTLERETMKIGYAIRSTIQ